MRIKIFFTFFILFILVNPLLYSQKFVVYGITTEGILINKGQKSGVKVGLKGKIFYEIKIGGKKKPIYIATFKITKVNPDSSEAKVINKEEDIKLGYFIQFDKEPPPPPKMGQLIISSKPPGVNVYINDKKRGTTPFTISLNPDVYKIKLIKPGYKEINEQVKVSSGETIRNNYYLSAFQEKGNLIINTNPSGSIVFINGTQKGRTPLSLALNPRTYHLKISKSKFEEINENIRIESRKDLIKSYNLKQIIPSYIKAIQSKARKISKNKQGYWEAEFENNHTMIWILNLKIWVDKYEVSRGQYNSFINKSTLRSNSDHPIMDVSFEMAKSYCRKYGYRLLTEVEWEIVAGNGIYPWGNEPPDAYRHYRANFEAVEDGYENTAPVKSFEEYCSPYGIVNLSGNVWEWVAEGVAKGGCFFSFADALKIKHKIHPRSYKLVGFRCAREEK